MVTNIPYLCNSLKQMATPVGIPHDQHIGMKLPAYKGQYGQWWASKGSEDGMPDLAMHITEYKPQADGSVKAVNSLITDRVSSADHWLTEVGLNTTSLKGRWEKLFLRQEEGVVPYLRLALDKEKGRKVQCPTSKSFLDPFQGNVYVIAINDLRRGIDKVKNMLRENLVKITYLKVDGTVHDIVTTLNQDFLHRYYGTEESTALGNREEETTPGDIRRKRDKELISGMIYVPDLEAPKLDGVFRQVSVIEMKKVVRITEDQIDRSFVNFDQQAFQNAVSLKHGNEPAIKKVTSQLVEKYGLLPPKEGETLNDYLVRGLSYTSTAQKKGLSSCMSDIYPDLDSKSWLGDTSTLGAEDLIF